MPTTQPYFTRHATAKDASEWIAKQGNRIFDVEMEDIIMKDLRGNDVFGGVKVSYDAHDKQRNTNFFPSDNYLTRYSKNGY